MITVSKILEFLSEKYPVDTACDFDNVGLIIGDGSAQVSRVMVTLDCDTIAAKRAVKEKCELIITHHPVIFGGIDSVLCGSVVFELIKNGISVISMHTNLDQGENGVNDQLCKVIGIKQCTQYIAKDNFILRQGNSPVDNPDELAVHLKTVLKGNIRYVPGNRPVKRVLICCGSGGDYIKEAISNGFDALITSDVKHHQMIEAISAGISLYDAGHYHTENPVIVPLAELLKSKFSKVDFITQNSEKIKCI